MESFTATRQLNKFFWQLEMFDVCTTGDTAHIDTIFKLLPRTRQRTQYVPPLPRDLADLKAQIIAAVKNIDAPMLTGVCQELEYCIDVCRVTRGAPSNISSCQKKLFQFSCGCEQFH
jgi:hypothetical protein